MLLRLATTAALLVAVTGASAQAPADRDPFVEEIVAIRARRIETVSKGVVENGIILIRAGKITAVGTDVKIPVGTRVIMADTVMPGIVGAFSRIGLSSSGGGAVQFGGGGFGGGFGGGLGGGARAVANPHHRVNDELYPFDEDYERLLRAGVTTLGLIPGGTGINGQGAAIKPAADSAEKMALAATGPLAINFSTDTQAQDLIRTTLEGGRVGTGGPPSGRPTGTTPPGPEPDPESADDDFQRGQRRTFQRPPGAGPAAPTSVSLMARRVPVMRAVAGETSTFVNCADSAAAIYALQLLAPFDRMKPIYILSSECYRVADALGAKKASVIIPADLTFEPNTRNRVNPAAILSQAGAKIACRPPSDDPQGYESLRFKMAELVRAGLDRETALKSITLHPAEMLGVADRLGSIESGRDANVILLDGDPFAAMTRVRRVLLEGKEVYRDR